MSDPAYEFTVAPADAGARLDVVLVRHVPNMSRDRARASIAAGHVRVDGRRRKKGDRLEGGEVITLSELPEARDFSPVPNAGPLDVLLEHEALVVVSKPRGLATHPLLSDEEDSLAQRLLHRYPEMGGVGYAKREPGVLHRLDLDTSGVVVAARTTEAFESLRASLTGGRWTKRYQAVTVGAPRPETIRLPLRPDPADARRMQAVLPELAPDLPLAETIVHEVEHGPVLVSADGDVFETALVELAAPRARRHQVRAHLAFIGHALVGDVMYGGPALGESYPAGHWLHANHVCVPIGDDQLVVDAPLPAEMRALLEQA